jgi:hypothetical protein
VIATDAQGNQSAPATYSWQYAEDSTPVVRFINAPPLSSRSRTATFTFTVSDPSDSVHAVSFTCALDGVSVPNCASPQTFANLVDGQHVFTVDATTSTGLHKEYSYVWSVDTVAPTVHLTAPAVPFTLAHQTTVAWTSADNPGGSAVAYVRVRYRSAGYGGGFGSWVYPSRWQRAVFGSITAFGLVGGNDYCYEVQAVDNAGNTSAWTAPHCIDVPLDDIVLASSGWTRHTGSQWWNGTVTATTRAGATLSEYHAELDRVAVLATTCASCGVVGVYVNGVSVGVVNLHASSTHYRVLFVLPRFSSRTGTVVIRVLSIAKTVQIDGLGVSRT